MTFKWIEPNPYQRSASLRPLLKGFEKIYSPLMRIERHFSWRDSDDRPIPAPEEEPDEWSVELDPEQLFHP